MVDNLDFLVAPLLLAAFGLPAAFAPVVRHAPVSIRFVMSFMAGVVGFVVWVTLVSLSGVPWSAWNVIAPLGVVSIAGAVLMARLEDRGERETGSRWDLVALVVGAGAVAHVALMAATSKSTSIDFFYFWGVKAVRFAEATGIDAEYLASPFTAHAHVPYPPLVPLVGAWGVEVAGRLPWRAGLVSMAIWLALTIPVVLRGLRSRLPAGDATIATGVWVVAMSLALASSYSGGSAEPPLVFFTTVAVVALISREGVFPVWVAPIAVCGTVLTKSEGIVLWVLLVVGQVARELLERRPLATIARRSWGLVIAPPVALSVWTAFLVRHDLALTDAARESVGQISVANLGPAIVESLRYLESGSGWLAWGLAAFVLALSWRNWKTVLPALSVMIGVLGFLLVYYLHFQGDALDAWVRWTLPRVSLTALSAALLAAAVASGGSSAETESTEGVSSAE